MPDPDSGSESDSLASFRASPAPDIPRPPEPAYVERTVDGHTFRLYRKSSATHPNTTHGDLGLVVNSYPLPPDKSFVQVRDGDTIMRVRPYIMEIMFQDAMKNQKTRPRDVSSVICHIPRGRRLQAHACVDHRE